MIKFLKHTLHPFLFAVFPLLFFFAHNQSELSPRIIQIPLVLCLALALATLFLSRAFLPPQKAALFTSLFLLLFFIYGHIATLLNQVFIPLPGGTVIGPHKILLPLALLSLAAAFLLLKRSPRHLLLPNHLLTLITAVLTALQLVTITKAELKFTHAPLPNTSSAALTVTDQSPDIYYLILDAYANHHVLKDLYAYDNSPFITHLKDQGFTVIDQAASNYAHTHQSLATSLNFTYVNDLIESLNPQDPDVTAFHQLIKNNQVAALLKASGYTIINFPSGWGPTDELTIADQNLTPTATATFLGNPTGLSEFHLVFLQTTALSPFIKDALADEARKKVLFALDQLPQIPYLRGHKFVLAHFNLPHPPYLFDAQGNPVSDAELKLAGDAFQDKQHYLGQLQFITQKIQAVIDALINNSPTPPIIVLQSDHGPASILGNPLLWPENPEPAGISERLHILNAYFLPGYPATVPQSITPVNTFPLIFNYYFSTNLPLQENLVYYTDYNHPQIYHDVTNKLSTLSATPLLD